MGAELRVERWAECGAELEGMFAGHLTELDGGELELDVGLCEALDAAGAMMIVTGRSTSGGLLGYCIWTFGPSLEHKGELLAELKPWYVAPEARASSLGVRLLKRSLTELRSRGISRCFPHHWGDERLGRLFVALGARPREWVFELDLSGGPA